MDPFSDSRLRIRRARQHFELLNTEICRWLDRKTYAPSARCDVETRQEIVGIIELEATPVYWPLIIDEIVQHLRFALDNAIHRLTIAHSGAEAKSEFPIFIKKERFEAEGRKRMAGISLKCQAIVEQAQPFNYNPPDSHALWALHELSNAGKHQVLPLAILSRDFKVSSVVDVPNCDGAIVCNNSGPVKENAEVFRWGTPTGERKMTVEGSISRDITFGVGRPQCISGQPIVEVIDLMGTLIRNIILALEQAHLH